MTRYQRLQIAVFVGLAFIFGVTVGVVLGALIEAIKVALGQ